MSRLKWARLDDARQVAEIACQRILEQANSAIEQRNVFRIVLAGGSTPRMAYELLRQKKTDWQKWEFYFGDERCLPVGHAELNSTLAANSLLNNIPISPQQVFAIPAQLGPEQAAELYAGVVQKAMPFDLVLLGMGEDGHTASIFPGQDWQGRPAAYAVHDAPKPPPDRVTLSIDALGNTRHLLYLITGAGKVNAVAQWLRGEVLPVGSIPIKGSAEVLIDEDAYPDD
jgi:6-phosphogluconolactonase